MSDKKLISTINLYIKLIVIFRRITSKYSVDTALIIKYNLLENKERMYIL